MGGGQPHGSEVHTPTYAKFQVAPIAAVYKARFTRTASLPISLIELCSIYNTNSETRKGLLRLAITKTDFFPKTLFRKYFPSYFPYFFPKTLFPSFCFRVFDFSYMANSKTRK